MASLPDLLNAINTKYGAGTAHLASRGRGFVTVRFSTGIFDFDAAIGGGIPWGRFVRVFGPFSGGKTILWLKAIAGAQNYCRYCRGRFFANAETGGEIRCACLTECPDCTKPFVRVPYSGPESDPTHPFDLQAIHDEWSCECLVQPPNTKAKKDRVPKVTQRCGRVRTVWLDVENCFDRDWAKRLGLDLSLVYVIVPEYAEAGVDIAETFLRSAEIDAVVVDSIADMTPSAEIERSAEEPTIGLQARLINMAMRKWGAAINSFGADAVMKPVVLLINQTRDHMERGEVTPGGWQQYFKSSIDIRVDAAKYAFKEVKTKGGDGKTTKEEELLYLDATGRVKKNKTHPPMKRFSYRFYMAGVDGFDCGSTNEAGVVLARALEYEVIARSEKDIYSYGDFEWKTQKSIAEQFETDPNLFYGVRDATMAKVTAAARGT